MLSHHLARALPSRRARITVAAVAYLFFAAAVVTSTLHREEDNTLREQAGLAQYYGRSASHDFDFATAERYLRASIEYIRACGGEGDDTVEWYAEAHEDLADALAGQGRLHEAESTYRRALRLYERADGPRSENCIDPLQELADIYSTTGRDSAAQACVARVADIQATRAATAESEFANFRAVQRATAKRHAINGLETANRLVDLGNLHIERGRADLAESEFAEAYSLRLAALGPRDHRTVEARDHLGQTRGVLGKVAQARVDLESALANNERAFGRDGLWFLPELNALGRIAMKCADYAGADSCYSRVLENTEKRVGPEHWYLVPALENLSECRVEMGQFAVARGLRERIMRIHTRALGEMSYAVGVDLLKLAEIDDRAGASGWARAHCSSAVRTLTATVGPRHPMTVEARIYLSELWADTVRPEGTDARAPRNVVDGDEPAPGEDDAEDSAV